MKSGEVSQIHSCIEPSRISSFLEGIFVLIFNKIIPEIVADFLAYFRENLYLCVSESAS